MRAVAAIVFGLLAVAGATRSAGAQDRVAAEAAFREGRALMKAERFEEACDKLALSQRLDPAVGTLTNLGVCHEKLGKLATAWAELNAAADLAAQGGQDDRADKIRSYARAIEPRLSRLLVRVAGDRPPNLVVTRDGEAITMVLGTAVPIDPGSYLIEAQADGSAPWRRPIEVSGEGETVTVDIELRATDRRPARRRIALGLGIGGGAAVIVGLGFGWRARALDNDSSAFCNDANQCSAEGLDLRARANTSANVSNILVGVGAAAAIGAGVLWYRSREAPESPGAARLVPHAGPDGVGLAIAGWF